MSVTNISRHLLTSLVGVVDDSTGALVKPLFMDLRQRVSTEAPDDRFTTVDSAMYWDALSLQALGDARHWWVIADLSDVVDPFAEMTVGSSLRVPTIPRLLFNILDTDQEPV